MFVLLTLFKFNIRKDLLNYMRNLNFSQKHTIYFYLKVSMKSSLFFLVLLAVIPLTLRINGTINISTFHFTKYSYLTFVCLNLFFLISSTLVLQRKLEIMDFFEKDTWKYICKIYISNFLIMSIIGIFGIVMMLIFKNPFTSNEFLLMGIIHFLIIYYSSNLLSMSIGIGVAYLMKNQFAIVVSLIIFVLLLRLPYMIPPDNLFGRLFNFYDDDTFFITNDLAGVLFNVSYFLDKIFIVLFILFFTLLIRFLIYRNKKILNIGILTILLIFALFVGINYTQNEKVHYKYPTLTENGYKILSQKMNLELSNKLINENTLNIQVNGNTNIIHLLLDSIFDIKKVTLNDIPVDFTHKNNILEINGEFKEGTNISLKINYQENVNIVSNIGFNLFYVTPLSINLTGDSFYWYPRTSNMSNEDIYFEVYLKTKGNIFSNLPVVNSNNNYIINGKSSNISIFSGQYKVLNVEGIEYIIPISYDINSIHTELKSIVDSNQLPEEISKVILDKSYKRLIIGVWTATDYNNFVKVQGDTLLFKFKDY